MHGKILSCKSTFFMLLWKMKITCIQLTMLLDEWYFNFFSSKILNWPTISFQETKNNFREWTLVVQEIVRFMKVETAFMNVRPLRYCNLFDSYPSSVPYVARFHAKKMLKFRDALLASYHRNEVNDFKCLHDLSLAFSVQLLESHCAKGASWPIHILPLLGQICGTYFGYLQNAAMFGMGT